jgi:hypothetical protein
MGRRGERERDGPGDCGLVRVRIGGEGFFFLFKNLSLFFKKKTVLQH